MAIEITLRFRDPLQVTTLIDALSEQSEEAHACFADDTDPSNAGWVQDVDELKTAVYACLIEQGFSITEYPKQEILYKGKPMEHRRPTVEPVLKAKQ